MRSKTAFGLLSSDDDDVKDVRQIFISTAISGMTRDWQYNDYNQINTRICIGGAGDRIDLTIAQSKRLTMLEH